MDVIQLELNNGWGLYGPAILPCILSPQIRLLQFDELRSNSTVFEEPRFELDRLANGVNLNIG